MTGPTVNPSTHLLQRPSIRSSISQVGFQRGLRGTACPRPAARPGPGPLRRPCCVSPTARGHHLHGKQRAGRGGTGGLTQLAWAKLGTCLLHAYQFSGPCVCVFKAFIE